MQNQPKEFSIPLCDWPKKTPGVRIKEENLGVKFALFQLAPHFSGEKLNDNLKIAYTCNVCGHASTQVNGISNGMLEKAINRSRRLSDDGLFYFVNPMCAKCQKSYQTINPRIGNNQSQLTIDSLREIYLKGGFTLIVEKIDTEKRLSTNNDYDCSCNVCNNEQKKSGADIKRGRALCDFCNKGKVAENRLREALEQLFGKPFPTRRNLFTSEEVRQTYGSLGESIIGHEVPSWLEVDCYCKELMLGLEHHGDQHYEITKFTPNIEALDHLQRKDKATEILCAANQIELIIVDQLKDFSPEGIRKHLEPALIEKGYFFTDREWNSVKYTQGTDPYSMKILRKLEERGYKPLTPPPYHQTQFIKYLCDKNHEREAMANSIEMGHGCLKCAGKAPVNNDELDYIAGLLDLIILSTPDSPKAEDKIEVACTRCNHNLTWKAPGQEQRRLRWFKNFVTIGGDGEWELKTTKPRQCNQCKWKLQFLDFAINRRLKLGYVSKNGDWKKRQKPEVLSEDQIELLRLVELENWGELDQKLEALGWSE